ncbi:SRPBCC family protein [Streptomyces cyaneofuscatus]|uniref:SRPBCC family protein n=1 Tax=Streptomyces cyaneofuscatus TaxID=66883 RepID=UPI003865C23B|nr:SRPBCC family protein [Streptomyces cyaneofuscatus]
MAFPRAGARENRGAPRSPDRAPTAVRSVLEDETLYGEWSAGTSGSRPESGRWPESGASITYHVHVGPKRFAGRTVVRCVGRPGRLELEAEGGPRGTARIAFDIRPWGEQTLVIVDEHPLRGLGGTLHNPLRRPGGDRRGPRRLHPRRRAAAASAG